MEFLEDKKGASLFRVAESPARLKGQRYYIFMFVAGRRPVSPDREKPPAANGRRHLRAPDTHLVDHVT